MFALPKKTFPIANEWICDGVPCRVLDINENWVTIVPFNGSKKKISKEIYDAEFVECVSDGTFVYAPRYPDGRVLITEFDVKAISIVPLKAVFKDHPCFPLIEKAEQDAYHAKGNNFCIKLADYRAFTNRTEEQTDTNSQTQAKPSSLERVGDAVFNRQRRHCPPVPSSWTRAHFEACPSFPAPVGIRAEDFAFPSEQNAILKELLTQVFSCANAPDMSPELQAHYGLNIQKNTHKCDWCGEIIDIAGLNQVYCATVHSVNFCHRDPKVGTKCGNVYIGHCSCNREQGGYSETERVDQILRLAFGNPEMMQRLLSGLNMNQ
jgi:hypothetical protein